MAVALIELGIWGRVMGGGGGDMGTRVLHKSGHN